MPRAGRHLVRLGLGRAQPERPGQVRDTCNEIAWAILPHRPLVEAVAAEGKLVFASTGMSTFERVEAAVEMLRTAACPVGADAHRLDLSDPPNDLDPAHDRDAAPPFDGEPVGYSGHERLLEPSLIAAALGAVAIKRRITFDSSMYGSDRSASLEPDEMKMLVSRLGEMREWLGDGEKQVAEKRRPTVTRKLRYWLDDAA